MTLFVLFSRLSTKLLSAATLPSAVSILLANAILFVSTTSALASDTPVRTALSQLLVSSKPAQPPSSPPIRPKTQCPTQLEALVPLLLRDLPSYANRVSQRAYTRYRTSERPGYVLLAGRPEYQPLSLGAGEYSSTNESNVPQVFFTTLERQYFSSQAFKLQHYHWLFLAQTQNGWRFVLMLSAIGDQQGDQPPTPPQDSSQGVIAQAVRLWLRDCETGNVAP